MPRRVAADMKPPKYPDAKRAFTRWDIGFAEHHVDNPKPSLLEQSRAMESMGYPVNVSILGQYKRGQERPPLRHCLPIARWYDVPLDEVLKTFHYPTVADIIVEASKSEWKDKGIILYLLQLANKSPEWKAANWRDVAWRRRADEDLVMEVDLHQRAQNYALDVLAWQRDAERNLPFERHSTDDLPIVAS